MDYGVYKIGNWVGVANLTGNMAKEMKKIQRDTLVTFSKELRRRAKEHIVKQDLDWQGLSLKYLLAKRDKGYSHKTYRLGGDFYNKIKAFVAEDSCWAGFNESDTTSNTLKGKRSTRLLSEVAKGLEFGVVSKGLVERPLWRPTLKETLTWYNKTPSVQIPNKFTAMCKTYIK
jgi:hypothetical protein